MKNSIPTFIMLVGLPGSGKSYFANKLKKLDNFVICSSDELRKELFGSYDVQDRNNQLFYELHNRIKQNLKDGKNVIYDATNISKKKRKSFLTNELKSICCVKKCICIMTPYEDCIYQNSIREKSVPNEVIKKMYSNWSPPNYNEGWDDIEIEFHYVNTAPRDFSFFQFFYGKVNACSIDHDNPHHTDTIGNHCVRAYRYILNNYPNSTNLAIAALLHDIGKPFTKSRIKFNGDIDSISHYYNHQNCGAYDSMFYLKFDNYSNDSMIYISNLIYEHMRPFSAWQTAQSKEKDMLKFDKEFFNDLEKLHNADISSH